MKKSPIYKSQKFTNGQTFIRVPLDIPLGEFYRCSLEPDGNIILSKVVKERVYKIQRSSSTGRFISLPKSVDAGQHYQIERSLGGTIILTPLTTHFILENGLITKEYLTKFKSNKRPLDNIQ